MTFQDAVRAMERHFQAVKTTQRRGQAYYNWFYDFNPRAGTAILSSEVDPFYDDDLIPAFLNYLAAWEALWHE